jgi:hypothetical protein
MSIATFAADLFTPEHDELRASVRRFVESELAPHAEGWEKAGSSHVSCSVALESSASSG